MRARPVKSERAPMVELERRQQEAQTAARQVALNESRKALLSSPRDIVAGDASGDVTLVEFFDYNCGYCKRALSDVRALMKNHPKLRVVLKDFPVLGPDSVEASRVSLAVKQQLKATSSSSTTSGSWRPAAGSTASAPSPAFDRN
jgi:protein-disulfide isomerase